MAEEIWIVVDGQPGLGGPLQVFVEVENEARQSVKAGEWRPDVGTPFWRLGPFMANFKDDRPMQAEHINADGNFQSDKYPWCAAGFVPLKLSDPMAMGPLWAYARARAFVDTQFSNDLAVCLARAGYVAAMQAVRMANGEPMREAF